MPMKTKASFSHLNDAGHVTMVNVGHKPVQQRTARATASLLCQLSTIRALKRRALPKGDVLTTAQIAGIQAAKQTAALIPLCHSLPLSHLEVSFAVKSDRIVVECIARTSAQTGVEMEALTGASVAALTLYDMCKAVDKTMHIENVRLLEKVKS
jgi:cyclic pyranopterin phosphate synthase